MNKKDLIIRNSTAEFLIFSTQAKSKGIEVRFEDENLWLTQKMMAELFQVTPQNITLHLQAIYKEAELDEGATCKDFLQVQKEGNREVNRQTKFYNLDAVISVGYRVNSKRATEFRQYLSRPVLKRFNYSFPKLIFSHQGAIKSSCMKCEYSLKEMKAQF